MSDKITVDRGFFDHLLKCMAKQKSNCPNSQGIYVGVSEPYQEMIDAAYRKAKALLSQDSQGDEQGSFRRFKLIRSTDVTGISGTGEIAMGIQWPDLSCHLFWFNGESTAHHKSIVWLKSIHCYNDASGKPNACIEWVD